MKTSELIGPALDWAVAKCEGYSSEWDEVFQDYWMERDGVKHTRLCNFNPSTNWSQGGPIIDREGISWHCGNKSSWHAYAYGSAENFTGPTPLIAAMRCFVTSCLGDEVDIPKELK